MAFRDCKRVDFGIDCVIEGQMGKAFTDSLENPTAFKLEVGPFSYFAGNAKSPAGREMMRSLPLYAPLMPSPVEWIELAKEVHGDKIAQCSRYSFSSKNLSVEGVRRMLRESPFEAQVRRLNTAAAGPILNDPHGLADISNFDSADDFVARGVGFYLMDECITVGVAYSSLVCSKGIEISIFVVPEKRRKGIATALACKLLEHCMANGMDPHWDAANLESCKLAEKLGYVQTETYVEYFVRQ